MKRRSIAVFVIVVLLISLLSGCNSAPTSVSTTTSSVNPTINEGKILIGFYGPLTGPYSDNGVPMINGAKLAIDEINASGGLLGRQVELKALDDQSSPELAVSAATKLVKEDKVVAIVGSVHSSNVMAAGPTVEEAKVPQVGVGTSPGWLQKGWKYSFRSLSNSDYSSKSLLQVCKEKNFTKMAIICPNSEYGLNTIVSFEKAGPEYGVSIVAKETFTPGDTNITGQMVKLVASKPDVIFLTSDIADAGNIIKGVRLGGWDGLIMGDIVVNNLSVAQVAGEAINGCIFATQYLVPKTIDEVTDPTLKVFFEKYIKAFGKMPENDNALRTYDAVKIIAEGIKKANSAIPTDIRDGIASIKGLKGLAGEFDFTAFNNGEGIGTQRLYAWSNGTAIPLEEYLAKQN